MAIATSSAKAMTTAAVLITVAATVPPLLDRVRARIMAQPTDKNGDPLPIEHPFE